MEISRIYEAVNKNLKFDVTKCKERSKLKTENLFTFERKEQLFRKFRATCGKGYRAKINISHDISQERRVLQPNIEIC